MRYVRYALWTIIVVLVILFVTLNSHSVAINYYVNSIRIYFPFLLLIVLIIGAILGIFALIPSLLKMKFTNRKLKQRIREIEQEVTNLRTMPIKDGH